MYIWVVTDFVDQKSLKTLKPKLVCARGRLLRNKSFTPAGTWRGSEIRGSGYQSADVEWNWKQEGSWLLVSLYMNQRDTQPLPGLSKNANSQAYSSQTEWKTHIQVQFPDRKKRYKRRRHVRVPSDWLTACYQ